MGPVVCNVEKGGKDMKKGIVACLAVLVASVFVSGVYAQTNDVGQQRRAEIKQEMDSERADAKSFHDSLKKMTPAQRKAATASFRTAQAAKRKAFRDKMESEMKADMQNRPTTTTTVAPTRPAPTRPNIIPPVTPKH